MAKTMNTIVELPDDIGFQALSLFGYDYVVALRNDLHLLVSMHRHENLISYRKYWLDPYHPRSAMHEALREFVFKAFAQEKKLSRAVAVVTVKRIRGSFSSTPIPHLPEGTVEKRAPKSPKKKRPKSK